MAIDYSAYENVIDFSQFRHEQRLTEREQAIFAGIAVELLDVSVVGDVIIGESDEGDGWLAVMNQQDEMFMHIEKLAHDRWLIAIYWNQHPTLEMVERCDADVDAAPIPRCVEFVGPIEEIRNEESFLVILLLSDQEGLTYG